MIDYFIVSLAITLLGIVFNLYPPSRLHGKYGYRSKAALKCKESWELAQRLARVYVLVVGFLSLGVSTLFYLYSEGNQGRMLAVVIPIGLLLGAIWLIEQRVRVGNKDW